MRQRKWKERLCFRRPPLKLQPWVLVVQSALSPPHLWIKNLWPRLSGQYPAMLLCGIPFGPAAYARKLLRFYTYVKSNECLSVCREPVPSQARSPLGWVLCDPACKHAMPWVSSCYVK